MSGQTHETTVVTLDELDVAAVTFAVGQEHGEEVAQTVARLLIDLGAKQHRPLTLTVGDDVVVWGDGAERFEGVVKMLGTFGGPLIVERVGRRHGTSAV